MDSRSFEGFDVPTTENLRTLERRSYIDARRLASQHADEHPLTTADPDSLHQHLRQAVEQGEVEVRIRVIQFPYPLQFPVQMGPAVSQRRGPHGWAQIQNIHGHVQPVDVPHEVRGAAEWCCCGIDRCEERLGGPARFPVFSGVEPQPGQLRRVMKEAVHEVAGDQLGITEARAESACGVFVPEGQGDVTQDLIPPILAECWRDIVPGWLGLPMIECDVGEFMRHDVRRAAFFVWVVDEVNQMRGIEKNVAQIPALVHRLGNTARCTDAAASVSRSQEG